LTHRIRAKPRTVSIERWKSGGDLPPELIVDPWEDIDARLDLERILSTLPQSDADLLTRHYIEGYTQAEIAAEQGVNQSTISRRIHFLCIRIGQTLPRL